MRLFIAELRLNIYKKLCIYFMKKESEARLLWMIEKEFGYRHIGDKYD